MTQNGVGIFFLSSLLARNESGSPFFHVRLALCHVRLAGASEHKSRHWAV